MRTAQPYAMMIITWDFNGQLYIYCKKQYKENLYIGSKMTECYSSIDLQAQIDLLVNNRIAEILQHQLIEKREMYKIRAFNYKLKHPKEQRYSYSKSHPEAWNEYQREYKRRKRLLEKTTESVSE